MNTNGVVITEPFEASEVNMYLKINAMLDDPTELNPAQVDNINSDMVTQSYGNNYIFYYMELKDEVIVQGRPEFDGRFFVKIQRDDILGATVLNETPGDYIVLDTYEVAYIANEVNNPANNNNAAAALQDYEDFDWPATGSVFTNANIAGTQEPFYWYTNVAGYDYAGANLVTPNFGPGLPDETEQFWNWWWSQGEEGGLGNTARTTRIFVDQVPAYKKFEVPIVEVVGGNAPVNYLYDALEYFGSGIPVNWYTNNVYNDGNGIILGGQNTSGYEGGLANYYFNNGAGNTNWPLLRPNYQPTGFGQGSAPVGEKGQITFSTIGQFPPPDFDGTTYITNSGPFAPGEDTVFKSKMQTPGTLFRFTADPNQNVYKVKANWQWGPVIDGDQQIFEGPINISSINYPPEANEDNDPLAHRSSFITRFIRLDGNGNEMYDGTSSRGIDINTWDPRGEVQHNGIGSMTIEIVEFANDGELTSDSVETESACWETEPKEDIDVDIYYEASGGIPLRLRTNRDLKVYTMPNPIYESASKFSISKRVLTTTDDSGNPIIEVPVPWSGYSSKPFVYQTLVNDAINIKIKDNEGTLNNLTGTELPTMASIGGVAIDDEISFLHPNGLLVKSKIIDHVTPTSYTGEDLTVASSRETHTTSTVAQADDTTIAIPYNASSNIAVGWQVESSEDVESGTFVTAYDDSLGFITGTTSITLSKPLISAGSTFTFIEVTGWFKIDTDVYEYPVELGWFNCYSFGNGVESDRIRDDFNAPQIDNGVKASATFLEYREEHIGSGLIHSSELYNETASVNGLNEFSMAQKITKNLNPTYGSVQAMKARFNNLVVFAEDRVLKVIAGKDVLYNADGDSNLVATNRVLGDASPYVGDYGISKNPESLAWDQYRLYFTDKQRGAVLRLSNDGLTPISNVGMKTYFREYLKMCEDIVGTFDVVNGEYNVKLGINEINTTQSICTSAGCTVAVEPITVSFNEGSKGWVSFKSFVNSCGVSVSGKYVTAPSVNAGNKFNDVWMHYSESANRNSFYGQRVNSKIEILFNDQPDSIKSFKTINYEGSQSRVNQFTAQSTTDAAGNTFTVNDDQYYNLNNIPGWYVSSINTDTQEGQIPEFRNKENKYFNNISGITTTINNIDEKEFSVQGIGFPLEDLPQTSFTSGTVTFSNIEGGWAGIPQIFAIVHAFNGAPPYNVAITGPNNYVLNETLNYDGAYVALEWETVIVPNGTGFYQAIITDDNGLSTTVTLTITQDDLDLITNPFIT